MAKSSRPIMQLLDLLGQRWALRVLWELRGGPLRSRALREACDDISPTVLQKRLNELRKARLVDHDEAAGYALAPLGRDLLVSFEPLYAFADRWAKRR